MSRNLLPYRVPRVPVYRDHTVEVGSGCVDSPLVSHLSAVCSQSGTRNSKNVTFRMWACVMIGNFSSLQSFPTAPHTGDRAAISITSRTLD